MEKNKKWLIISSWNKENTYIKKREITFEAYKAFWEKHYNELKKNKIIEDYDVEYTITEQLINF